MKMIAGRKEGRNKMSEWARKSEKIRVHDVGVCARGSVRVCVFAWLCVWARGPVYGEGMCVWKGEVRVCVCVFRGRSCVCVGSSCVCGGNVCVDKESERGPRGQDSKPFYVTRWKVLSKGFRQNNLTHQSSWLPSEACSLLWLQQFRSIICRVSSHFLQAVLSTFRSGPQIGQNPDNAALPPLLHQEQCKELFSFHSSSLV